LEECFFQGEDPFFQARQTPDLLWGGIVQRESWPNLSDMDAYRCMLDFHILSTAPKSAIDEYFRYIPEQIIIEVLSPLSMIIPTGDPNGGPVYEDFVSEAIELLHKNDIESFSRAVQTMLELSSPDLWLSSALRWLLLVLELEPNKLLVLTAIIQSISSLTPTNWLDLEQHVTNSQPIIEPLALQTSTVISQSSLETDAILSLLSTQREILQLPTKESWEIGRLKSVVATLKCCLMATQGHDALSYLETAADQFYSHGDTTPLILWIDNQLSNLKVAATDLTAQPSQSDQITHIDKNETPDIQLTPGSSLSTESNGDIKFGRRAEDTTLGAKSLKVDQVKIDRLMNLIGEMVVSKNALPYLANRAETIFGVRELSREIKTQYGVINRIAEEMQDAIMQVRMMPVSFVFQRFPRLVRDISRKLGKEVNLILEGEDTEADKNIIESLGDPLVHIVRNSLDHGFELPEVRRAVGKPAVGTLIIRATQVSDRVIIEIIDDGKGIDPEVIKRKAYEKGILNEAALERISDLEAVNLVFAAGFSTAEVISDLSGRGVGMDVVRTTVENVNGSLSLESEKGKGTRLSISLPLSMAVTNVMIIECYGQQLGVPMDSVVETVRIPRVDIRCIKQSMATVLRGRIVPLKSVNQLLGINAQPRANEDDELAILVVRVGNESLGLLVDNFRETIDIILKPMTGLLAEITAYSGSALMGDGSVLLVLNIKDLLQ
jgi:two-component system chemotaxis sensor kinase CheA